MDKDPNQIVLTNVRLNYPSLFKPKKMEGQEGEPKYSAAFSMDAADPQVAAIRKHIASLVKEKLKGVKTMPPEKICLRDGDLSDSFEDGTWYLSASNIRRPQVVNRDRSPLVEEDDVIYPGCYVNAVVRLWVQDNKYGKRVNASLEVVQFRKDGERFGPAPVDVDDVLPDLDLDDPDLA